MYRLEFEMIIESIVSLILGMPWFRKFDCQKRLFFKKYLKAINTVCSVCV